ncbi:MAG TPA: hypothetical protein DD490_30835 [Acidobacteria bacterium]|nr:hypothetical protein [Acidobacteriota bacterium]
MGGLGCVEAGPHRLAQESRDGWLVQLFMEHRAGIRMRPGEELVGMKPHRFEVRIPDGTGLGSDHAP